MRVKWYVPYLFVLPAFLLIVVVLYNPIVQNMYTSLFSTAAFSSQPRFVGLQNYASFFSDANLLTAFRNNIYYGITCIVFQCGLGLVLAIIMESKLIRNHSGFFRTVYFIPSVISITAAALLWKFIYQSRGGCSTLSWPPWASSSSSMRGWARRTSPSGPSSSWRSGNTWGTTACC